MSGEDRESVMCLVLDCILRGKCDQSQKYKQILTQ